MQTFRGNVVFTRRRYVQGEGYQDVESVQSEIELTIDVQAIIQRFGTKAIQNKTKKAKQLGGLMIVRALNPRRIK